jgi:hypothetical protein
LGILLVASALFYLTLGLFFGLDPPDCPRPAADHARSGSVHVVHRLDATPAGSYREDPTALRAELANVTFFIITSSHNHLCNETNKGGHDWPPAKAPEDMGGEQLFTSLLRRSPYRTFDPTQASLYIVPVWPWCIVQAANDTEKWLLESSEWGPRYQAQPRRFLIHQQSNQNSDHLGAVFKSATILHNGVKRKGDSFGEPASLPLPDAVKDIPMPYCSSASFLYTLPDDYLMNKPRPYMFAAHWDTAKIATEPNLRLQIKDLFTDPAGGLTEELGPMFGAAVPHTSYVEQITQSVFCAVARGHTPTTRALFNMLAGGCIPILFSDRWHLPFVDQLPWHEMVIFAPEEPGGPATATNATTTNDSADVPSFMNKQLIQEQMRRLADDVELQRFMRANVIKYRRRFFFGTGRADPWDADWDSPVAGDDDRSGFWGEGSLLVESALLEARKRVIDGIPGPNTPSRRRSIDDLVSQIDHLKAVLFF